MRINIRIAFTSALICFGVNSAQAGTYAAMCDRTKCNVYVSGKQISSPFGTIPSTRVTQWGNTGKSKTNISTGIGKTILLGPLGLLGFLQNTMITIY
mgnify:CR=1 FL=1